MSSSIHRPQASISAAALPEKSYFETQRAALLSEIEKSFEAVLANINKLNRSLEGVIAVGNEFSSVEALWSQFETVRAKDSQIGEVGTEDQRIGDEESGEGGEEISEEEASRR